MTRKDYIALARALMSARLDILNKEPPECHADMYDGVSLATDHIIDVLARDNPRFDRARFLSACGVQS